MAIGGSPPNAQRPPKDGGKGAAGRHAFITEVARGYLGALWLARDPQAAPGEGARLVRHVAPLAAAGTRAAILDAARWGLVEGGEIVEGRTSVDLVLPLIEGEVLRSLLRTAAVKHIGDPLIVVGVAERVLRKLEELHRRATLEKNPHGFGGAHPDSVIVDTRGDVHLVESAVGAAASSREPWKSDPQRLGYFAPEQAEVRATADARTDVFAMGVVLWEALSGRRLFPGNDAKTARERVQKGPIARLDATRASAAAGIATPIADVVARALERDPAARFQTATEMADALRSLTPADAGAIGAWVTSLADVVLQKRNQLLERAALPAGARGSLAPPPPSGRPSLTSALPRSRPGVAPAPASMRSAPTHAKAPAHAAAPAELPTRPFTAGATAGAAAVVPPRPLSRSASAPAPAPITEPEGPPTESTTSSMVVPTEAAGTEPDRALPASVPSPEEAVTAPEHPVPTEIAPAAASATPDTEPSATEAELPPQTTPETRAEPPGSPAIEPLVNDAAAVETDDAEPPDSTETDVSDEPVPDEDDDTMMSAQPVPGAPASTSLIPLASKRPPALPLSIPPAVPHLDSLPVPTEALSRPVAGPSQLALLTAPPEASLGRRRILLLVAAVGVVGIGAGFFMGHLGSNKETRAEAALSPVVITAPSNPAAAPESPAASGAPAPSASVAPAPSAAPALSASAEVAAGNEAPAPSASPPPEKSALEKSTEDERPAKARGSDTPRTGRTATPGRPSTGSGPGFKPGGI